MQRRLNKVERILAVRGKLHRLAEWKVATLDREKAEVAIGQSALLDALNRDEALHGLFVEAMARRLTALAREAERIDRAREVQSRRLLEEGLRLKLAERMTERVRRAHHQRLTRQGFEHLLEALLRPDGASFP